MRGFAAIGLSRPKNSHNIGGILRGAHCYDAALIAIGGDRSIASRIVGHPANVTKAERHIPLIRGSDLRELIPFDCVPVAVDLLPDAIELQNYQHPARAFYIFGPEDGTLGEETLCWCRDRVMIPTRFCMNLAATVNVVLYDRMAKQLLDAKRSRKAKEATMLIRFSPKRS